MGFDANYKPGKQLEWGKVGSRYFLQDGFGITRTRIPALYRRST